MRKEDYNCVGPYDSTGQSVEVVASTVIGKSPMDDQKFRDSANELAAPDVSNVIDKSPMEDGGPGSSKPITRGRGPPCTTENVN